MPQFFVRLVDSNGSQVAGFMPEQVQEYHGTDSGTRLCVGKSWFYEVTESPREVGDALDIAAGGGEGQVLHMKPNS